ncbi:type II toxin-antitoxin system Phd/YefM family antitoxin [Sphingomonas bacterium]|uniref:type II toxin-antitoxin system Phd/YefM family antitoxin n=1 Tax=Sphingomonas bacterium TaxID=1895847 RepID=UPI001575691E|nr:type II toxin-antitoxin system Phd/YefM family antitoxin [Sphingomonas bacterium]
MGKMVGMAEFKANCTRLLREVEQGGEPITVTVRGKPVAVVKAAEPASRPPRTNVFGMLKSNQYRFVDPFTPVSDMAEWEVNNPPELYRP